MRSIATPEIGIFVCGGIAIVFAYVMVRASYERMQGRGPFSRWDTIKFWKEVGGGMIWLAASLATLAIFVKEYHDKLTHPY